MTPSSSSMNRRPANSAAMDRRGFLHLAAGAAALGAAPLRAADNAAEPRIEDGIAWHDVTAWGVEGRGWSETKRYFDRLPARAEGAVRPPVWRLSRDSAGMLVRFESDAPALHVDYKLRSGRLALPHMPATGVSGVDLYGRDDAGRWRWVAASKPQSQHVQTRLIDGLAPGRREYMLYLPLYNGVETLHIGVPTDAGFTPIEPRQAKPIVFYGTSIMHGACASRPGMAIPAILGRRLNRPTINLGFSGNGTMDPSMGKLLGELDAAAYAIDCLPNMRGKQVAERTEPLVRQIRSARPNTPIVLVEDRTYANTPFIPAKQKRHEASRAALREAYERLKNTGVKELHYLKGETLLGSDREDTVDSSHPTDLGMVRYADAYEPVLRRCLKRG